MVDEPKLREAVLRDLLSFKGYGDHDIPFYRYDRFGSQFQFVISITAAIALQALGVLLLASERFRHSISGLSPGELISGSVAVLGGAGWVYSQVKNYFQGKRKRAEEEWARRKKVFSLLICQLASEKNGVSLWEVTEKLRPTGPSEHELILEATSDLVTSKVLIPREGRFYLATSMSDPTRPNNIPNERTEETSEPSKPHLVKT